MNHSDATPDCQWAQDAMLDVHDDAVDAAQRLCAHLEVCEVCRGLAAWESDFSNALRQVEGSTPVASLHSSVDRRLYRRALARTAGVVASAAGILLAAGLSLWIVWTTPKDIYVDGVTRKNEPAPQNTKAQQRTMLAAFGQSAPVIKLGVVDRHQDALTTVLDELAKESH